MYVAPPCFAKRTQHQMSSEVATESPGGEPINELCRNVDAIAELHTCLTSSSDNFFRLRLLQAMEGPLREADIERMSAVSAINEHHRHLDRLFGFGLVRLVETSGEPYYERSRLAEKSIDTVGNLERRLGKEAAQTVYSASLGPDAILLFLKICGDQKEADLGLLRIRYTPVEIRRLSLSLPRVIEGSSAVFKLNEAGLLVYRDDGHIYMPPILARSLYQYLRELYGAVKASPTAD